MYERRLRGLLFEYKKVKLESIDKKQNIASCFEIVYNKTNLKEVSLLECLSGILYASNIEDISNILGSDMLAKKKIKFK